MTGVEILATQEVATVFAFSWENFWIGLAVVIGLGVAIGIITFFASGDFECLVTGFVLGAIFGVIIGVCVGTDGLPTEYETRYKVTISDEVSMNDFLERYQIVSQEGKIYTVRMIEDGK